MGMEDLIKRVEGLRKNKAAGPDMVRGEVLQEIIKSRKCREALAAGLNGVCREEEVPSSWKVSRTKMIKKVDKPTVKEFRPIAVTSVGYKLYWGFLRDEIEDFMVRNGWVKDCQVGFTKGGRMEYNLFIMQYMVDRVMVSRRVKHKNLILVALDFRKAYDSIDRGRLIETLVKYKINPLIINMVAKVCSGDTTNIKVKGKEENIRVTSGIKQGCTASTVFFKLITYMIIEELEKEGDVVEVDGTRMNSIWFADDSILAANSLEGARKNIRIVREVGRTFGLEINDSKSMIMIYKGRTGVTELEGIKVVNNIKYLGMEVGNKKDILKGHKEKILKRAEGMATQVNRVIETSCNKLLVGKTWWKCGILSGILMGAGVMNFNVKQVKTLQKIENRVYRGILGAIYNSPKAVMRGEIGSSLMETRIIESRLTLVRSMIESDNKMVKDILGKVRGLRDNAWNNKLEEYLGKVELRFEDLETMNKRAIKKRVRERDNRLWREELENLSSVEIYRNWKTGIREERCYDNTEQSTIQFRARANSLQLNDRKRFGGGDTTCELCGIGEEDLGHFLLRCQKLEGKRRRDLLGDRNREENIIIGELLFSGEKIQEVKEMLGRMWRERGYIMRMMGQGWDRR